MSPIKEERDMSFQVMPNLGKGSTPIPPPLPVEEYHEETPTPAAGGGKKKIAYFIVAIVALLIIGALAYFLLGQGEPEPQEQTEASKLPVTWLQKNFNTQACTEQAICGDEADPDNDGLHNYDEFRSGTNPANSDTDGDGLADGDEINIYQTEPTLSITNRNDSVAVQNNWLDGIQIKNGYDPLTPRLKFTETRLNQINQNIEQYKLHEPTTATLNSTEAPTPPAPQPTQ